MGFKQVFDNLTFKHMDVLRKQILFLVYDVLNYYLWTYANFKEILRMIPRIK